MRKRTLLVSLLLLCNLVTVPVSAKQNDDLHTHLGADYIVDDATDQEKLERQEKQRLARIIYEETVSKYKRSNLAPLSNISTKNQVLEDAITELISRYSPNSSYSENSTDGLVTLGVYQPGIKKTLSIKAVKQSEDYYCGPASAKQLLDHQGRYYSQSYLAGKGTDFLKTTTAGTGFASHWKSTLQTLDPDTTYVMSYGWNYNQSTWLTQFLDAVTAAIGYTENGVIANAYKDSGTLPGINLVGWGSTAKCKHYVTISGYDWTGTYDMVKYADPARADLGISSIRATTMARLTLARGIVW